MSAVVRTRPPERLAVAPTRRARTADVLFVVVVSLLCVVHLVIFVATAVLAPVTAAEQRSLDLLQLPVEVARALVLPFHALLLGCLFILGRRAAGRWAGFGSMLAVLALDLRADPAQPVYGPATAEGGWIAAALLAAAFVLLARRPVAAALLVGAASGFFATAALALPAFLVALALHGEPGRRRRTLAAFAGAWAAVAVAFQLLWLGRLGTAGWAERASELAAEFRPHAIVPWLEQQTLVFAAWHFPPLVTLALASFLFLAAGTGVVRYFVVPREEERGARLLAVARRLPVELWAAALTLVVFSAWWGASGDTAVILPNLPVLAAIAPLLTAMAYRGAKWLLTVNRFWAVCAVLYLTGLILARSTQLVFTLVHAFLY